jgi:DNA-binding NarL/FixJ family response regulator
MLQLLTDISHIDFANFSPMLTLLDEKNEVLYFSKTNTNEQNELCSAKVVHLTRREKEIIRLLAKGLGSKQISVQLNIAKNTVENHRQHILRKICCNSSAEVVAYAARYGFL